MITNEEPKDEATSSVEFDFSSDERCKGRD